MENGINLLSIRSRRGCILRQAQDDFLRPFDKLRAQDDFLRPFDKLRAQDDFLRPFDKLRAQDDFLRQAFGVSSVERSG